MAFRHRHRPRSRRNWEKNKYRSHLGRDSHAAIKSSYPLLGLLLTLYPFSLNLFGFALDGLFHCDVERALFDQSLLLHALERIKNRIQSRAWGTVRVVVGVCPGKVLAVVTRKVQVVQCVVSGRVDVAFEKVTGDHVTVVDENAPQLDKDEESKEEDLVNGENVHEEAAGQSTLEMQQ